NSSGDILRDRVVALLRDFFGLKVESSEEFIEDAKITNDEGGPVAFIETKGVKSGVKREFINQVDSHRERHGFEASIPGLLIINNEMSLTGIDKRLSTTIAEDQIKHARNLNVLIVRTIDLLFFMKQLESAKDRKTKFLEILNSGGGWLKASATSYNIIKGS